MGMGLRVNIVDSVIAFANAALAFLIIPILVILVILASPRMAHAEPAARLIYLRDKGTETCPSESDVRSAVQVRLGYDPFSTYASATMFVEVAAVTGGFTANLKLVDADSAVRGDRQLKVQGRCNELMDAMALTISIAIDPMSVTRNGPPPDAPPSEKPVDPSTTTTTTPPLQSPPNPPDASDSADRSPSPPSAKSVPLVLSAGLGPLASLGSAPALSFGGALSVDAQLGQFLGGVEGRADLPASASAGAFGRVESSLLAGTLFGGVREGPIFACLSLSLGRLAATSTDVAQSRDQDALYVAAGFRIGVGIAITERIEARARAEVLANLDRHALQISSQQVYEYPVASGNLSAAIAFRFR